MCKKHGENSYRKYLMCFNDLSIFFIIQLYINTHVQIIFERNFIVIFTNNTCQTEVIVLQHFFLRVLSLRKTFIFNRVK